MPPDRPASSATGELFAFAIAHDLRQPLVAAVMTLEPLLARATDPMMLQGLTLLRDGLADGLTRIEALLSLARVTRTEPRHEPVDVTRLVSVALERLGRLHPSLAIDADLPEGLTVHSDPRFVAILIDNLVSNALVHGSSGERVAHIEVTVEHTAGRTTLVVRDRGRGFEAPSEHIPGASGSGLGLSIARAAALHLGGDLWHEPAEPGTRACVRLP